jgi:hypothetical protein
MRHPSRNGPASTVSNPNWSIRRATVVVELGDVPIALRVVVVGVDHDLAGQLLRKHSSHSTHASDAALHHSTILS